MKKGFCILNAHIKINYFLVGLNEMGLNPAGRPGLAGVEVAGGL